MRLPTNRHGMLSWVKAKKSYPGGMCVEVAAHSGGIALRHSHHPDDGALLFTREEFAAFLDGAKRGEFDHLV